MTARLRIGDRVKHPETKATGTVVGVVYPDLVRLESGRCRYAMHGRWVGASAGGCLILWDSDGSQECSGHGVLLERSRCVVTRTGTRWTRWKSQLALTRARRRWLCDRS